MARTFARAINWQVPAEFPLCLDPKEAAPLAAYRSRLREGAVAVISPWDETKVAKASMSDDGNAIFILGEHGKGKPWSLSQITFEDGQFVHESCGILFTQEGADKEFTLIRGLTREGGETYDDCCYFLPIVRSLPSGASDRLYARQGAGPRVRLEAHAVVGRVRYKRRSGAA